MASGHLFDLSGRVALVTGGNSGLGLGFAEGIARCGGDVVIWGRRLDANARAAETLAGFGARVHHQSVDVSDEAAVIAGFAEAVEVMGRVDCVVANAGVFTTGERYHELPAAHWHKVLAIDLHGAHFTLQAGIRHMLARKEAGDPGGSLLVCGSLTSRYGVPRSESYAAAKGALASIVRCIAAEYGNDGIRANIVLPGFIRTDAYRRDAKTGASTADQFTAVLEERTPIPRWGYPADFRGVAAYLMSDAAGFHTGDVITIDGGWSSSVF